VQKLALETEKKWQKQQKMITVLARL
jgi:hypothetical protein